MRLVMRLVTDRHDPSEKSMQLDILKGGIDGIRFCVERFPVASHGVMPVCQHSDLALSREKILTHIDVREKETEFKGAEPRTTMLAELDKSVTNRLGETGEELIKLPPSPPKLP